MLDVKLSAFDLREIGTNFLRFFYQLKILIKMIYKEPSLTIEIFQDNLGEGNKGIILMVLPGQLSSDKKFLKLPS